LHPEGVGRLNVEIGGILVFVLATAEETEAARRSRERLVCLDAPRELRDGEGGAERQGVPSAVRLVGLVP